jgi:hypothetical protein
MLAAHGNHGGDLRNLFMAMGVMKCRGLTAGCLLSAIAHVLMCSPAGAKESLEVPQHAPICKSVEPIIEWLRLIKTTAGSEPGLYMKAQTEAGDCHVGTTATRVGVIDIDQRGFVLVVEEGQPGQWWMDARDVWGYFEAADRMKAWTKP